MKVLLLNTPREDMIKVTNDEWFIDLGEISCFPPIGLMYLAGYLRENSGHEVLLVDGVADGMGYGEVEELFKRERPDVLGITAFTYTFFDIMRTVRIAKEVNPDTKVVLGGPHIQMFPDETISHPEVDYCMDGYGEVPFTDLLERLEEGRDVSDVEGLIFKSGGEVRKNGRADIKNIDSLPFPAFDMLDDSKYFSTLGTKKNVGTICTSRGCPFNCTFCQVVDKVYRARSPENIVDEMELYLERGIDNFFFFDDMFNINTKRVISICDEILRRGLKVSWTFRGRVEQTSEEMLVKAREAGCHCILFGIEDYTNENLKRIRKKTTIEQSIKVVKLARKHKIQTSLNWIIGFPHHESAQDVHDLLRVAKKIDSDYAQFSILQLMPMCELYDECVRDGGLNPDTWSNFVRSPTNDFYVEMYEKHLTRKELSALYKMCYHKFYLRPSYIVRSVLKLRSFHEFKVKLRAFLATFVRTGAPRAPSPSDEHPSTPCEPPQRPVSQSQAGLSYIPA